MLIKADQIIPIMDEFFARIDAKNSWGKNEVKACFKEALISLAYGGASREGAKAVPDVENVPGAKIYERPAQINAPIQAQNVNPRAVETEAQRKVRELNQGYSDDSVF
jgi:hypothetical protein